MLVSFVISSLGREEKIFKTINSLAKQTDPNYELIIISDDPTIEKEASVFLHDQFANNEKIMLVFNSKAQGEATNWNNGIELASGDYIAFIKEGDILESNFISTLQTTIKQHHEQKLDIIQFNQEYSGLMEKVNQTHLKDELVYDLTKSQEVYAYINQDIYGKIFRLKYLKDFRITFKRSFRFDSLFLFKALGHARTYFQIGTTLASHRMGILKYSAFDLVNQWPHILNYYRRIGAFKDLKDELTYAYIYKLGFIFLKIAKELQNKQLYKKALKYSEEKVSIKLNKFLYENKAFLASEDQEFIEYMHNFESFIHSELKKLGK